MRLELGAIGAGLLGLLALAGPARAETKVEVKGVHLCCGACVKGVATALKDVQGVQAKCDRENGTVTLTAPDEPAARKALDALAAAGYHGDPDTKGLAMKDEPAPQGKVKSLSLTGIHNCCRSCNTAIHEAVKKVDGVTGDTAKAKTTTFEVTGDFDPAQVIKALNASGFHVRVKD